MAFQVNQDGGGRGGFGGGGGFIPPKTPSASSKIGANPGLITSTGGLVGANGLLFTPYINPNTNKNFLANHDITNFDTEESGEYDFRQETNYGQQSGEGRDCSIHLIILKYREIDSAEFFVNITVFKKDIDEFITVQIPVSIPVIPMNKLSKKRQLSFPDNRIHTVRITPPDGAITGERPQVSITRVANSGGVSITKLIMCGNADEVPQM